MPPTRHGDRARPPHVAALAPPDVQLAATTAVRQIADAWHDPAAWQGDTRAAGVTLPGAVADRVALNGLVLHGWDLALATGPALRTGRGNTARLVS